MNVLAETECGWTASTAANWISGLTPASGQGTGEIKFQVAPNPTTTSRQADIALNGVTAKVTQAGASCRIDITPRSQTLPAAAGGGTVTVTTLAGCQWAITSSAPWLTTTGSAVRTGAGTVSFSATPNTGAARTGSLTIGDQTLVVTQQEAGAPPCTYTVEPTTVSIAAAGGSATATMRAGGSCPWTAGSNAPWLTVSGVGTGAGDGSVTIVAMPNTGPARTGSVTIAGETLTVNQGGNCLTTISAASQAPGAAGGAATPVTVTSAAGCAWTSTTTTPWITITSGASGTGNGTVAFSVAANTGPARTGTITIAGQTHTVNQAGGCAVTISPMSQAASSSGGTATPVTVTAASGCAWTATTTTSWITISSGASGTGNGTVAFSVAANTGPARTGTITIAGQTHTVNQAGTCAVTISPLSQAPPAAGGPATSVTVTGASGCGWTATTTTPWITITSGASGTGNGTVAFTVAANTGPARTGTLSIGGQTHTVNQASGCAVSINPSSASPSASGGAGAPIAVSAGTGCTWTATTATTWITLTSGTSGTGGGSVGYTVAANTGAARTGTISIGPNTFTVSQAAAGCSYAVTPTSLSFGKNQGTSDPVSVTTSSGCTWTSTSNASWITVETGASGTGSGTMTFGVSRNTAEARVGTLTIAGQTFTVTQAGN